MRQGTRIRIATIGIGLALAVLACTVALAQEVTTNSMPGTDFTKYHIYKWVTIEGATYPNQILDAQIKQSVDGQLAAKGLTKTDGDKADLLVGYQVSIDQEKQWNAYGMGGMRWGWWNGHRATVHHQHRHVSARHVRPLDQTTRLDRACVQDARPRRESAEEAEKSGQGHAEAVEEFPA